MCGATKDIKIIESPIKVSLIAVIVETYARRSSGLLMYSRIKSDESPISAKIKNIDARLSPYEYNPYCSTPRILAT